MKILVPALMVAFALAGAAGSSPSAKSGAIVIPAGELKWTDTNQPGIQMAVGEGDPAKGASHFLVRFAPGKSVALHHHSAEHSVTVLSGTLLLTVDGTQHTLPAGSFFWLSPRKPHVTACDTSGPCELSIDARGKWDVVPEGKDPAAQK